MNFPLSGEIFNITTEGFENKVDEDDLEDTDAFARHEDSISKGNVLQNLVPHLLVFVFVFIINLCT